MSNTAHLPVILQNTILFHKVSSHVKEYLKVARILESLEMYLFDFFFVFFRNIPNFQESFKQIIFLLENYLKVLENVLVKQLLI